MTSNDEDFKMECDEQTLLATVISSNLELVDRLTIGDANRNFVEFMRNEGIEASFILHEAVMRDQRDIVELLLDHGADPNSINDEGKSVLFCATRGCDSSARIEIVKLLLSRGAKVNYGGPRDEHLPFESVLESGNVDGLELFLDHGVNLKKCGVTYPLHAAVINRNVGVLEYLLNSGLFNVNARDFEGYTLLALAIICNMRPHVRMLIARGVDVNKTSSGNVTPLYIAAEGRSSECLELLLAHGADVNAKTSWNESVLEAAIRRNKIFNARCIIRQIALIETRGLYVDPDYYIMIQQSSRLRKYYCSCRAELARMQATVIVDEFTTFFSILTKNNINLYTESMINVLEVPKSYEYPLYGSRIRDRLSKARERQKLKDLATKRLSTVIKLNSNVFHLIYSRIIRYLGDDDLHNLCKL